MFGGTRKEFLKKAEQLAGLIFDKLYELHRKPMKDTGLGSLLSIIKLQADLKEKNRLEEADIHSLEPKIYEVILYGSVAAGEKNPDDIDLMILDNGHFSNFFPCMTEEDHGKGDWYEDLGDNLLWLMGGWFDVREEQIQKILGNIEVDLHVLPIDLLRSQDFRKKAAERHKDPDFFKNVFQKALRFNPLSREFEPLTLEYLEEHYHCRLGDLR
jgi:predicted nucleotidyltransferase